LETQKYLLPRISNTRLHDEAGLTSARGAHVRRALVQPAT